MLRDAERTAVEALVAWLRGRFDGRLRDLALFGSWARGEARHDSDVDVLVVVADLTGAEAREIAHHCGDLLTEHDVLISPLCLSEARLNELRDRERLLAREIDRDRMPL